MIRKNDFIRMSLKQPEWPAPKIVHVYDFLHDFSDTILSYALCWCPENSYWLTVNVAFLTPIAIKQQLVEEHV